MELTDKIVITIGTIIVGMLLGWAFTQDIIITLAYVAICFSVPIGVVWCAD